MIVDSVVKGYTQIPISTSWINTYMSRYTSKLLFQHHTKKFYWLIDRWCMIDPNFKVVLDAIEAVSSHWLKNVKGSLINMMLRRYMVFLDNPQWFGHCGETIFATNFSQLRAYLHRIIKVLNMNYLDEKNQIGYMSLKISKKKLIELGETWYEAMITLCSKLLSKYLKNHPCS